MKIAFIGQSEYFSFIYDGIWTAFEKRAFEMKFAWTEDMYSELVQYDADINIFFRGEFIPDSILRRLSGAKIAVSSEPFPRMIDGKIVYTRDSYNRLMKFMRIKSLNYDYIFHYDMTSLSILKDYGIKASGALPLPVSIGIYRDLDRVPKWDGFFIGRSTPRREDYLLDIKHKHNFLHVAHGIWGEDLVELANQSRICLNLHAEDEVSWEPRIQMLLAMRRFIISEPISPNEFIRPGEHFVEIRNRQECHDAFIYYLNHEEERKRISDRGMHMVCDQLDSELVFARLAKRVAEGSMARCEIEKVNMTLQRVILGLRRMTAMFSEHSHRENVEGTLCE